MHVESRYSVAAFTDKAHNTDKERVATLKIILNYKGLNIAEILQLSCRFCGVLL